MAWADRPDQGNGDVEFFGSYGIPASACVVAYDSIQRLLLVRSATLVFAAHRNRRLAFAWLT